jgi:hypothetical protein
VTTHKNILLRLFGWYFCIQPRKIVLGYAAYATALFEIVPFGFLLLTLFSPWKNIKDRTVVHGFNLNKFIERLSLDLLARGTGFVVRILTMTLGLLLQVVLLAVSLTYLLAWICFPVWGPASAYVLLATL